jgi:hypothetical protein
MNSISNLVISANGVNLDSIQNICENSKQVMIYGWKHCGFYELNPFFSYNKNSPFKKVFTYHAGEHDQPKSSRTTLEARVMDQIQVANEGEFDEKAFTRPCKAALTNLILENYKRTKEKKQLIPIIFFTDIDNNRHPANARTITSREFPGNNLVTNSELRRVYKLCNAIGNPELEEIARKTFKFAKVTTGTDGKVSFLQVEPFWEAKDWKSAWQQRLVTKIPKNKNENVRWKEQLIKMANIYAAKNKNLRVL